MTKVARGLLAALFLTSGTLHLVDPRVFESIMPPRVPFPGLMVVLSGIAEITGAIALLVPPFRRMAGWGLAVLLVAVFPANIFMAWRGIQPEGWHIPAWLLWARLPLQPLLIWWVLATAKEKSGAA